jgi:ABC-2 type transport system permease protein
MSMLIIFMNELRRLKKDTFLFVALLGMPLALMAPALLAYSNEGEETLDSTPLMVANYDRGDVSVDFIEELDKNLLVEQNASGEILAKYGLQGDERCAQPAPACDEAIGRARIADRSRQVLLIIPNGLTTAFEAGKQTPVTLLYDPGADAILTLQVEKVAQGLAIKVALTRQIDSAKGDFNDLSSIGDPKMRAEVERILNQPAGANQATAIHVDEVSPSSYKEQKQPQLLGTIVPGNATMFAFIIIMFIGGWAREEKFNGVLRRLLSTPATRADLLGGKLIFGIVVNFVQLAILFTLGLVMGALKGMEFNWNLPALVVVCLALSASATSLGLVFASTRLPMSLGLAPVFVGAILGGCFMAVDILPPYLRALSYAVPQYYAVLGFQDVLVRGGGLIQVLPEVGMLLVFAAVFFGFSLWRFDMLES